MLSFTHFIHSLLTVSPRARLPPPPCSPSTSDVLYQLLTSGSDDTSTTRSTVDKLVDQLIREHAGKPFTERQLGRGPWQVRYSRGPLAWKGWTGAKKGNAASQEFITETKEIINTGEILGNWITVSASGRFKTVGENGRLPVMIRASVEGGKVCVLGKEIELPIRGKGEVKLMFIDDRLRVFQSPRNGATTVQVR